jgi:hypothetical protein
MIDADPHGIGSLALLALQVLPAVFAWIVFAAKHGKRG